MVKTYRQNQAMLKIAREIGRIPKTAKLNAKKGVLEALARNTRIKRGVMIKRLKRKLEKSKNNLNERTIKMGKYISIRDVIKGVAEIDSETHHPMIRKGNMYYTMNRDRRRQLLADLNTGYGDIYKNQVAINYENESDDDFKQLLTGKIVDEISISWVKKATRRQEGAYFPYTHNTTLDLSRYQIYSEIDSKNYNDNCLIHALTMWGKLTEGELTTVKGMCRNSFVPQSKFKVLVADIPDFGIIVKRIYNHGSMRSQIVKFNAGATRVIELALVEKHYFINEPVECTSYAIKNYDKVKDKENWNEFRKKDERDKTRFIDSYKLVKILVEQQEKLLKPIKNCDQLYDTVHYDLKENITDLTYGEGNVREVEYKEKENEYEDVVIFDFETVPQDVHQPYLVSYTRRGADKKYSFRGKSCAKQFLDKLKNNTLCMAHNLGYDINFIINHLTQISVIKPTASSCISARGVYYNNRKPINLTFKCTYAMVGSGLGKFGAMFGLKQEKEVMPYNAYTVDNTLENTQPILVSDGLLHLKEEEHNQFLENIDKWDCRDGDKFDHMKYSQRYCEIDVEVTKLGYDKFREWISEITGLDIDNYLTLASVAYDYVKKSGCLTDCYEFSGNLQMFLQNFVVGGRTMMCSNEKSVNHIDSGMTIADFDGVSLYPSAMSRMLGMIKGKPKVVEDLTYEFLKQQDQYFVLINVTKINKHRKFPLLNRMTESGTRLYSNELTGKHYVDKVGLEDLIKFQDIEFEIIRGYYFNEGFNTQIRDIMLYLFNKRKEMKEVKNPIQAVYKLLMNSAYGKMCLKPIDTQTQVLDKARYEVNLRENYNHIKSVMMLPSGEKFAVSAIKPVISHYNSCHQGSYVLSTSKRIMNEVMCLGEDLNIRMFYQDTDSIHMDASKTKLLSDEFRDMYGRELIGKGLGQFHNDFDFKSEKDVYADKSIFLGKKCYIDRVVLFKKKEDKVYKKNKSYPEEAYDKEYDYHIRMKGVPGQIVDIVGKQMIESDEPIFGLYEHMYEGNPVVFDLLSGTRPCFRTSKGFEVRTLSGDEFTRTLVF